MELVSAAKGHSTLVGWASLMTFANVALVIVPAAPLLGSLSSPQLQVPSKPASPLPSIAEGRTPPSQSEL